MPNYTENYKLKKPLPNENYNIQVHNDNMDSIDTELKNLDNKIKNIEIPVTSVNNKTGDIVLTAEDVGAETPAGVQAKAEAAASAAVQAHKEDPDPHNQYALDINLAALQEEVDAHKADYVSVKKYGAKGDGITDDTIAFQSAIDDSISNGYQAIFIPAGVYIISSITIPSYVSLFGENKEKTILKLKSGAVSGQALIKTFDFDNLTGTGNNGGVSGVSIKNVTLDGNKINNSYGYGIKRFGYRWTVDNIDVANFANDGIYTEWGYTSGAGLDNDYMEDMFTNIRIHDCNGNGLTHKGPHDSHLINAFIYLCSGHGIEVLEEFGVYTGAGFKMVNVHVYGCGNHGIVLGAGYCTGMTVVSESNNGQSGGTGGDGIHILGNYTAIYNLGTANNKDYGIKFGEVGAGPASCIIHGVCSGNYNTQVNIVADGGRNNIDLTLYNGVGQFSINANSGYSIYSTWNITASGADPIVVRRNFKRGFIYRDLPAGTGIENAIENTHDFPVVIYMTYPQGVHVIDFTNYDQPLSDAAFVYLQPGDKIYFETALPTGWIWYPAI